MSVLVVTTNPRAMAFDVPGVRIVGAREYLGDPSFSAMRGVKVFNLCRSYRYQTVGYYVSLLGEARGHRPLPSIATIQDLRLAPVIRVASQDVDHLIRTALRPLRSDEFELSIYFGRNLAKRYDPLCLALFNQFPAPFLRARFCRDGAWSLEGVRIIGTNEIPESHRAFMLAQAERYLARAPRRRRTRPARYDLAILHDEDEPMPPSNRKAIRRFVAAGERVGFGVEVIGKDAYGRVAEFDALFIRETTAVPHHTYRFARRATAEGLVVIDDPDSILRCTNKVYVTELLTRHRLRLPRTIIVSRETAPLVAEQIGFPCVIKRPDGSFSRGVMKYEDEGQLAAGLPALFEDSELLLAQEFVPTPYDWRVGVLDGEPLFVCRYHMAPAHWQIVKRKGGKIEEGTVDTLAVEDAPPAVVSLGVRAARLIGRGLYGVDIKEVKGKPVVLEINDNPNVDGGFEDRVLGPELYERIMRVFLARVEAHRGNRGA